MPRRDIPLDYGGTNITLGSLSTSRGKVLGSYALKTVGNAAVLTFIKQALKRHVYLKRLSDTVCAPSEAGCRADYVGHAPR